MSSRLIQELVLLRSRGAERWRRRSGACLLGVVETEGVLREQQLDAPKVLVTEPLLCIAVEGVGSALRPHPGVKTLSDLVSAHCLNLFSSSGPQSLGTTSGRMGRCIAIIGVSGSKGSSGEGLG